MRLGKCQVSGCQARAKNSLYQLQPSGEKVWVHVCEPHERRIGDENMRRAGGRYYDKNEGGKS